MPSGTARGRASAGALDIRDRDRAVAALDGADVLLNSASYRVNLDAMEVALAADAHYVDLGGLFHVAREQLLLDDRFREAGLLAVLGMGSTPGKTNVMAARAVELLGDDVERIVVGAAGRDPDPPAGPLVAPYAIETILDELSMPTPVVRDGEVEFVDPLTDAGTVEFGPPAGPAPTIYTIHSEQATFAESFGARNVSFQLSLNPVFLDKIRLLTQLGLAGTEPDRRARDAGRAPPGAARAARAAAQGVAVAPRVRHPPHRGARPRGRPGDRRVRHHARSTGSTSAAACSRPPARRRSSPT